eukprot:Gb_14287 [translate_table: standard]
MFWRMTGFSATSPVELVLDKETCTLEELFDEEEIIQECKALNNRLINFLRVKAQVQQMLRYIVEEPLEGAENKRTFRFPFIACEIFTCEIDVILKTLVEDEELMNFLFSFLEPDRPHRTLLAGYFSKVVICLLLRKTVPTMRYFQAHQEMLVKLVNLIGITSIMEVLIRLFGADDHMYTYHVDALQWLADTDLLEMLVDKLSVPSCPEVNANSAEALCAITRLAPSALASKLSSPSFVGRLFHNVLEDPQSKSTLVHSLSVCISLLDPKRVTAIAAAGAAHGNHITEPVVTANPETVDVMLHRLGELLELLNVSSDAKVLPTTYGELQPPLGMHRLKIVEFIAVLLRSTSEVSRHELVRLGAIQRVIKLFFDYPFNNALHHHVESIIYSCLDSNSTLLIDHLFQDCDLIGKLLLADEMPLIVADTGKPTAPTCGKAPPRTGNMGHMTRIANRLCQLGNTNLQIQGHLQANADWSMWQMTVLQGRNTVENVFQWACGRPTTAQERNLDSDEDEFRDRDYDVSTMANNLTEAFRYGMFENGDAGEVHGTIDRDDEDVFFDDDSAEVVISSLELREEDSGRMKETMFTNANWFAFQDGPKQSTPTFLVSSPLRIDDCQPNNVMTSTTSGGSSGSDDEVVVGEDEELIDTASSHDSSFATAFDTEFGNDLPQNNVDTDLKHISSPNSIGDLSLELEKVGLSDISSLTECEERNMDVSFAKSPNWMGLRKFADFEGTSGRIQLSKKNSSEINVGNAAQGGDGSALAPPDQVSAVEMDTESSKDAIVEGSNSALQEGAEADGLRGRMGLPFIVENVEFVGVEV